MKPASLFNAFARLAAILAIVLLLSGCSTAAAPSPAGPAGGVGASITGASLDQPEAGQEQSFTIPAEAGDPIGIDFRGVVTEGGVRVRLLNAQDQAVWEESHLTGPFVSNTLVRAPSAGEYRLGIAWDGPVKAQYSLVWQPGPIEAPRVTPLALLAGVGMLGVAVGFIVYALRGAPNLGPMALGGLLWLLTVALKFGWAIPANAPVHGFLQSNLPAALANGLYYLYGGILTGIFEVGGTYLAIRAARLKRMPWRSVLAFGVGFGAVETLLLSIGPLAGVLAALTNSGAIPLDSLQELARYNQPLEALMPVWERFFTMWIHIFSTVLIFSAIAGRKPGLFWLAFVYKSSIDAVGAYAQLAGLSGLAGLWWAELLVAAWGIAGWIGTLRLQQAYGGQQFSRLEMQKTQ